jgi:hypothetical protein
VERSFDLANKLLEIKIFIMFILRELDSRTPLAALYELAARGSGVGYFDFVECLNGLVKTGHAVAEGGKYCLTDKGVENIAITEKNLPYSLRLKAERAAREHRAASSRDAMIRTTRAIRRSGGYTVELSLSDREGDIVSVRIFAPGEREAIDLENGFRERAEKTYGKIIDAILGDAP